ncbi:MAG TPA: aldolase/citrate lyase family protein [Kiritimatiellia bacterium]|nr:aldolase/citrate lyase family protein [Kiritimatiellia bacterium]HPS06991.1 aldolase/citrate lyase family protein [Kiritimatiellia bacterium]
MSKNMRPSRTLAKLRSGGIASCFKLNLSDARAVEIAALAGFDCLWTDMEHVPNDLSVIEKGIWAAKAHDTDVLVRVSRGGYSDAIRPLEMDAAGIMVPHVMSLADAQAVVRMTRFHPLGRRPVDGGNADGAYCGTDFGDYLKQANEQRFVIVQIEDPEPLAELDDIAALPGIDMLFFGPGDFSQGIGAPGQWDHPKLLEARRRVAAAALSHGKFAGTVACPANLDELVALGYRFLSMGADVVGLSQYCNALMAEFSKRPANGDTCFYGDK